MRHEQARQGGRTARVPLAEEQDEEEEEKEEEEEEEEEEKMTLL